MLTTPAGKDSNTSASASVDRGVNSEGLITMSISRGQSCGCLPTHQQQRIIPRYDACHDSVRFFYGEIDLVMENRSKHLAFVIAADFGVVIEASRNPFHFIQVFDQRFAAFPRQKRGDFLPFGAKPAREFVHHFRPFQPRA